MSEKISEYATSVTALASGDLMDVSKLISTSPDVYQSQKLNYSLLLTELNADLTINNLGNSDLTSTTNARYFKLNGDGTTNLLRVQNGSNQSIVQFRGDRSILIDGYTTNGFVKTNSGTGLISISSQVNTTEGGTGRSAWTANALPYISATNTFNEILAGTNGHVLTMVAGVPSWAAISAPNLGSANLTSSDDARTFTLKTGTTATQNFQIKNSAGANLFTGRGDSKILFGSSSVGVATEEYLSSSVQSKRFIGSDIYQLSDTSLRRELFYDAGGASVTFIIDADNGILNLTKGSYRYINSIGNTIMNLSAFSNNSYCQFSDSTGTTSLQLYGGSGTTIVSKYAAVIGKYAVSGGSSLEVFGTGSTSATTTALFQNSASVAALTIKDDLTSTFGGIVTVPQIITTPATITVTANAGTVTRANRINKFTNSSAATMTITMSTTAALDGDMVQVRIYDFSAAAQTITWVNTENSTITVPTTSNGSTTLPLTVGFQYNSATSKWRCIGSV